MSETKKAVENGDTVRIHFTGRLKNGIVFENTKESGPFQFVAGSNEVIKGMSDSVLGMKIGEVKQLDIPPENGFGHYDSSLLLRISSDKLPEDAEIGCNFHALLYDSHDPIPICIKEIGEDYAIVDFNHYLAGQTLNFVIKVVSVHAPEH